ncbi:hypothetical protein Tco_0857808 [Tanacetum coccineum]|uniref:Uncharacterized protein n=1 Tax=Tanacetum coccineum TaxID=301880 RepID=A0ABQ5B869_9ASTR
MQGIAKVAIRGGIRLVDKGEKKGEQCWSVILAGSGDRATKRDVQLFAPLLKVWEMGKTSPSRCISALHPSSLRFANLALLVIFVFAPLVLKGLTGIMTSKAQQIKLDNALVSPENRRVIGKCNMRINLGMKPKEPTYQVVLDSLALRTCYPAFLVTAKVLDIYMHQFWATVTKHKSSYRFKIENKKFSVNVKVFRYILNICLRIQGQEFDEPPTEEEALSFNRELGHSREIKYITDVIIDHLHQPWRTLASIINKFLCRKVFGLDKIRLSRVQILWGMYYMKNLDFVALIWEDLAYQIDNIDSKKQDKIFYPRFTKIIIHHFLDKDKSISMRNRTFMHTAHDDSLLGTMRFVSRHADAQVYGAILPKAITNQALLDSVAYKTYVNTK